MAGYQVISSDNHVIEPAGLWSNRGESKFKDRALHIERLEEGDWWFCDGLKVSPASAGTLAGVRFEDPARLTTKANFEDVPPGGYIPEEHVKDMDIDGIDVSIIYPTVSIGLYAVPDSELVTSSCKTYNDWIGEFCNAVPSRLKGICALVIDDVEASVRELERCSKMGLVGALIPVYHSDGRSYDRPEYEPLWAAAQNLGMPLSMHIGTVRVSNSQDHSSYDDLSATYIANRDHWVRMSLGHMIFSGVFERYPRLQVGSVEHELAWVPHFLGRIDNVYTQREREHLRGYRFKDDAVPSDFFHNNVFLGFLEDSFGIEIRNRIGVDQLQWGADYPHPESTFPRSRQILEEMLADCTDEEKAKIAGGNTARVYDLN